MSTRKEKSLSDNGSQDSTILPQPPTRVNSANEAGVGRGRARGGLAGSSAYLPLQEEQVAAVLPGPPSFLCTLLPAAFSRQSSLGRLSPMAQTPDGISCELRGKPCLAFPGSPPGREGPDSKPETSQRLKGAWPEVVFWKEGQCLKISLISS